MFSMIKERMESRRHDGELDFGDVVQAVILIAGFVIVTLIVVFWITTAINNKGADAAACIDSSSEYTSGENTDIDECLQSDGAQETP